MAYISGNIEQSLLDDDPEAIGRVSRWIAIALTSPRFWSLKAEWSDLHQETLARVVQSLRLGRYDASRDFRVYVQGIARITAMQALGRQHPSSARDPLNIPDGLESDPERHTANRQMARRVLDLASQECRDLIRAYFFDGQSYSEIAASHSVPIGTIKSRLFRCLQAAHASVEGITKRGNRSRPYANRMRGEERK